MSGQWPPEWEDPDDERPDAGLPDGQRPDDGHSDLELSEVTSFLASVPAPPFPPPSRRGSAPPSRPRRPRGQRPSRAPPPSPPARRRRPPEPGTRRTRTVRAILKNFPPPLPRAAGRPRPAADPAAARGSPGARLRHPGPGGSRPGGGRRRLRLPSMQAASWPWSASWSSRASGSWSPAAAAVRAHRRPRAPRQASLRPPRPARPASSRTRSMQRRTLPEAAPSAGSAAGLGTASWSTRRGTRYQRSTLASQVRAELDSPALGHRGPTYSANATASAPSASAPAASSSVGGAAPSLQLSGCVSEFTGGAAPSLVDQASYDGIPAYIIAVPTRVWVVGLGCTATDTQLIAQAPLKG